jgi:hypothetical protein
MPDENGTFLVIRSFRLAGPEDMRLELAVTEEADKWSW